VAQTIAVLSQKGGTGKTTLVRSLIDVLSRVGIDALAIDVDPQGNLSDYFDVDPEAEPTLSDVLAGRARAVDAIHRGVIPSNLTLAEAELMLAGKVGREMTLRNALREAKRRYDFVFLDCPPTLGLLTVNALVAADHALLSTQAEYFSLQGVEQALQVTDLAREHLSPELNVLGIVLNMADMRSSHARRTLEALEAYFGEQVCRTVIARSVAYAESTERGVPILDHRPSRGLDYVDLAIELLERLEMDEPRRRVEKLRRGLLDEISAEGEIEAEEEEIREAIQAPAAPVEASPAGPSPGEPSAEEPLKQEPAEPTIKPWRPLSEDPDGRAA
jgi:chromosome partitioning protein